MLDGNDNITISDAPGYDFENGFSISLLVSPATLGAATLVEKVGELGLLVDSDGNVTFTVSTDQGSYSVTSSQPLDVGRWQRVEAELLPGRLRLTVDGALSIAEASGTLLPGSSDIVIGTDLVGHLDSVALSEAPDASDLVTLTGLGADGSLQLDANGNGSFTITSNGVQLATAVRVEIGLRTGSPGKTDLSALCGYHPVIMLPNEGLWGHVSDVATGFVTGQGLGWGGAAGDVAAGVFIWGDIRDVALQSVLALSPNEEADWYVFGFAAGGLVLELFPGVGEPPDAVLAAVKVVLQRVPTGPFRRVVASVPVSADTDERGHRFRRTWTLWCEGLRESPG